MKIGFKISLFIVCILCLIQFFRPNKNTQDLPTEKDFLISEKAPKDIQKLYIKACYDCHSNHTNYKWLDNIAPISWYVDNNIKAGKYSLNFSNWEQTSSIYKEIMFQAILFDISSNNMPKKNYLKWHPDAELTDQEKAKMKRWLKSVKKRFLQEEEDNVGHTGFEPVTSTLSR